MTTNVYSNDDINGQIAALKKQLADLEQAKRAALVNERVTLLKQLERLNAELGIGAPPASITDRPRRKHGERKAAILAMLSTGPKRLRDITRELGTSSATSLYAMERRRIINRVSVGTFALANQAAE